MSSALVDPDLETLLVFLRTNRGFDFTGYKRSSLTRRVTKRMHAVGIDSFADYLDYLQVHPDEFTSLFNSILINVTSFFRDPPSWTYLEEQVFPSIIKKLRADQPIRIWSAGCASGEEAYSLAIVAAEALKTDRLSDWAKIYATDVDEEALAHARLGLYDDKEIKPIPPARRARYLERADGGFAVRKEIRRAVIFGRHDLVQDAPISRVDMIICRNTLMYFNSDLQSKVYRNFQFALNPGGYLFLGKSEMLLTRTDMFDPIELKKRIFRKVPQVDERRQLLDHEIAAGESSSGSLRQAAFEYAPIPQIVVERGGALVDINERARALFHLNYTEMGKPLHELELSYRPLEFRSRIERAYLERPPVIENGVSWSSNSGETIVLDVQIVPLFSDGEAIGVQVLFDDSTQTYQLADELNHVRLALETAHEEVQSTVEELETTNEELQSTNEELETTNEELQSTNEELETMNEELQSTNEELEATNEELHDRTEQLNESNLFLEGILGSLEAGVVVVDRDLTIQSWNTKAEDLWGLRPTEARGKHLLSIDIGLPVEKLMPAIRNCLSGERSEEGR